jgi:hypothetical protein
MPDPTVDSFLGDLDRDRDAFDQQQAQVGRIDTGPEDFDVDGESALLDFDDLALSIPRGVEGFTRSIGSLIPGLDLSDDRIFGRSDTVIGGALESLVQFGAGFVPGAGVASLLGKTATAAKLAAALGSTKGGVFTLKALEGSVAGGVADFLAFDGHEKNFSALIESIPQLENPLTEFLATDEEDSQVEARIKNVLEGFGMGAAIGVLMESMRGLHAIRKGRKLDTTPEKLKNAQVEAVDPGRLKDGMRDAEELRNPARQDFPVFDESGAMVMDETGRPVDSPRLTQSKREMAELAAGKADAAEAKEAHELNPTEATRKRVEETEKELARLTTRNEKAIQDLIDNRPGSYYKDPADQRLADEMADLREADREGVQRIDGARQEELNAELLHIQELGREQQAKIDAIAKQPDYDIDELYEEVEYGRELFERETALEQAGAKPVKTVSGDPHATLGEGRVIDVEGGEPRYLAQEPFDPPDPNKSRPEPPNNPEFEARYIEQTRKVRAAEKTPNRRLTKEEQALNKKDWKAFSRSRGYTEAEIADLQKLLDMHKEGLELGYHTDDMFFMEHEGPTWNMTEAQIAKSVEPTAAEVAATAEDPPLPGSVSRGNEVQGSIFAKMAGPNRSEINVRELVQKWADEEAATVRPDAPEAGTLTEAQQAISNEQTTARANERTHALMGRTTDETVQNYLTALNTAATNVRIAGELQVGIEGVFLGLARENTEALRKILSGDLEGVEQLLESKDILKQLESGLKKLKSEEGRALQATQIVIEQGGDMARLQNKVIRQMLDTGDEDFRALMKKMALAYAEDGTLADAAGALDLHRMTAGRQVFRLTFEYYLNSILSRPSTIAVQPMSAMLGTVWKPLENMLGGAMRGNMRVVRESMHELLSLTSVFQDSAVMAWRTFNTGKSTIDPSGGFRDDKFAKQNFLKAGALGSVPGEWSGTAANAMGNVIGLPSRAMLAADEFSKNVAVRSVIKANAMVDALDQGLTHSGAVDFANNRLKKLVVDGQIQTENRARMAGIKAAEAQGITDRVARERFVEENYMSHFTPGVTDNLNRAYETAREVTLQAELPNGSASRIVQQTIDRLPIMRFVVPFYRTGVNAAKFVGQRIDLISVARYHWAKKFDPKFAGLENTRSRFLQQMTQGDDRAKAEAVGRIAGGMGMLGWSGMMAAAGDLTGAGPSDPNQRKAMEDEGWMPYSLKTKNGYVQYLRMDPFGTYLGLAADLFDTLRMQGDDNDEMGHSVTQALLTSMANNVTSRSYLSGIGEVIGAMSDPERNMDRVIEKYAGAVIPKGLQEAVEYLGDQTGIDTYNMIKELRGLVPGLDANIPARRNMLGETIDRSSAVFSKEMGGAVGGFYSMIVPIAYREVKDDAIRTELANLKHGFSPPRAKLLGVDLRQVLSERGQSAHDRWSELHGKVKVNGKSLRQELGSLIRSSAYKRLSPEAGIGGPSPRVQLILNAMAAFRDEAFEQTLSEYPELGAELGERDRQKKARRQGISILGVNL